jgi:hypothetical protein
MTGRDEPILDSRKEAATDAFSILFEIRLLLGQAAVLRTALMIASLRLIRGIFGADPTALVDVLPELRVIATEVLHKAQGSQSKDLLHA